MTEPIIDVHAHLYSADEDRYRPITGARFPPSGVGGLEHLRRICAENNVDRVCAIQTGSFYRHDNEYVCDVAAANSNWIAGICMIDPEHPNGPSVLSELVRSYGIRGLRSRTMSVGLLYHPTVVAMWRMAAELDIVVNVLVSVENVGGLDRLLGEFPSVRVVVEHSLGLNISTDRQETIAGLARLAERPNAHVELCDMPGLSGVGYPFRDMHEIYLRIIEMFGAERCLWGSCFPLEVWIPHASYSEHLASFREELLLDEKSRAAVLGGTAKRLWFRDQ